MNAPELQRRPARRSDGIPQVLVNTLIQHGYLEVLRQRGLAGDWNCASGWAADAAERGGTDVEAALELLGRFAGAGRPAVVEQTARLLVAAGRVDEALELARITAGATVAAVGTAAGTAAGKTTTATATETATETAADLEQCPSSERAALRLLTDLHSDGEPSRQIRCVLAEDDSGPRAYAVFTSTERWDEDAGLPRGVLEVSEALATDPAATAALWDNLLSRDLDSEFHARMRPVETP